MGLNVLERDYLDIERQNSSWELRNQNYAGWDSGEHLWNVDVNNNMKFATWWMYFGVHQRRLPRAPWNAMYKWYVDGAERLYHSAPLIPTILPPFVGAKDYVWADRTYIGYSADGRWKPWGYVYPWRPMVEVSLFAASPRAGEIASSYSVDQPFSLTRWGPQGVAQFSRYRSDRIAPMSISSPAVDVLVNGVKFATAVWRRPPGVRPSSTLTLNGPAMTSDTIEFAPGDVISMRAPNPLRGTTWMTLSILGKVIEE